jgi:hypothetical protein
VRIMISTSSYLSKRDVDHTAVECEQPLCVGQVLHRKALYGFLCTYSPAR